MPDRNAQTGEPIAWPHEVCASCKRFPDHCDLMHVLQHMDIQTWSGMVVYSCGMYDPDEASPHFIPLDKRFPVRVVEEQIEELQRTIANG